MKFSLGSGGGLSGWRIRENEGWGRRGKGERRRVGGIANEGTYDHDGSRIRSSHVAGKSIISSAEAIWIVALESNRPPSWCQLSRRPQRKKTVPHKKPLVVVVLPEPVSEALLAVG